LGGKGKSILVFGIYLMGTGMTLLFTPNILLKILGIQETNEIWIRIAGCLALNIGIFNVLAARFQVKQFYNWMFIARGLFIAEIISFVVLGKAPNIFLIFAATDFLGIAWTYFASE
jgi:hypothetical protein